MALRALRRALAAQGADYRYRFAAAAEYRHADRARPRWRRAAGRPARRAGLRALCRRGRHGDPVAPADRHRRGAGFQRLSLARPAGRADRRRGTGRRGGSGAAAVDHRALGRAGEPAGQRAACTCWPSSPPRRCSTGRRTATAGATMTRLPSGCAISTGALPAPPPAAPFVLLGDANLDPVDGDGRPAALAALLIRPRIRARSAGGRAAAAAQGGAKPVRPATAPSTPPTGKTRAMASATFGSITCCPRSTLASAMPGSGGRSRAAGPATLRRPPRATGWSGSISPCPSRLPKAEFAQCLAGKLFLSRHPIPAPRDAPAPGGAPCHAGAAVLYRSQVIPAVEQFVTLPCALPGGGSGAARAGRPSPRLWGAWRGTGFRSQG